MVVYFGFKNNFKNSLCRAGEKRKMKGKDMKIKLLITGGTIDCERIEENEKYVYKETHLFEMLKQGKCKIDIDSQILMMKDSIHIT